MVSAAKLRKAQTAITEMRPYADKLDAIMVNILSNADSAVADKYAEVRKDVNNIAIVVVSSNRGLA
ncbi:unnamed protein product, partial [Cyprideis torosa]